ncbi:hypothetical protein H7T43_09290 [Peribacillus simplex]|uniref:hypothetical protein n=1 Tax=Peribacillus simplex TaxID=1478 RepID=UPI002989BC15|nr:hypothetical protein [Peribacillus simplex]MBX9955109.1 hypothetical protein [Peribacillus simplex]
MNQFTTINSQITAIKQAKASHEQYIQDLHREVSECQAEIHEIKNAPVREVDGKDINEVLSMQADKLAYLTEKSTKLESRREMAANVPVPVPFSAKEVEAEFHAATAVYKDEVIKPLEAKILELKKAYLKELENLNDAVSRHGAIKGETANVVKYQLGKSINLPSIGSNADEDLFVNREHQNG